MIVRSIATAFFLCVFPLLARADLNLPVTGTVTSGVGWRVDPFGSGKLLFHRGIDISVPAGTPVRATRSGRVSFAGLHGGHGSTVIIKHENGESTLYGHNSSLAVPVGTRVAAGDVIAYSGNSGRSTGPHVHYEVLNGEGEITQTARIEQVPNEKEALRNDKRRQQELLMDEAMDSILSRIRETLPETDGGKGG
ncbi:M23 family metallopeptidase [Geomonas sp. RF6]|uniref:M23 family metallopeptidase n=1 Tax=Geomonas sp. RF6 TaxID=2897342 RepID=UPI001E6103EA|nr:M23 family metallopeptidase [Geomonas sp. RF6]UFS69812.1 M23 family metallopeptidase [Geomonas sp. RF6]